ncbi:MAG: hypothetical protein ABII00_02350 [Elusimicrobiota bacterium]
MRFLGYLFAVLLMLLGLVFLIAAGSANTLPRLVIGCVIIAGGVGLVAAIRMRVPETRLHVTHKVDLTGDVGLESLKCRSCGAALDEKSVAMREGAIFVTCPYCKTSYQMEEKPKW